MRTVFKYKIEFDPACAGELVEITLPKGAKVLKVGSQRGPTTEFFLWAMVAPRSAQTERRKVFVVGTGHEFGGVLSELVQPGAHLNPFAAQESVVMDGLVIHFWVSHAVVE